MLWYSLYLSVEILKCWRCDVKKQRGRTSDGGGGGGLAGGLRDR